MLSELKVVKPWEIRNLAKN